MNQIDATQIEQNQTTETETQAERERAMLAPAPTEVHPVASVEKLAFNVTETAQMIGGICPDTVRRLVKRGKLKPVSGLRHLLFTRKEIERFLAR